MDRNSDDCDPILSAPGMMWPESGGLRPSMEKQPLREPPRTHPPAFGASTIIYTGPENRQPVGQRANPTSLPSPEPVHSPPETSAAFLRQADCLNSTQIQTQEHESSRTLPLQRDDAISRNQRTEKKPTQSPLDPEKALFSPDAARHHHTTILYTEPSDHASPSDRRLWILIYLSLLSPFFALLLALYALIVMLLLLPLLLILLFTTQPRTTPHLIHQILRPAFILHLRLIYSPNTGPAPSQHSTSTSTTATTLVLVSILSPLYASAIATAAWVAGGFWFFATILGSPGADREKAKDRDDDDDDDDGWAAVEAVRRWWETWLRRGEGGVGECEDRPAWQEQI